MLAAFAPSATIAAPSSAVCREDQQPSGTLLSYWLDVIRAGRGHSLRDVTAITGVSVPTLRHTHDSRRRAPRRATCEGLARYLDVQPQTIPLLWEYPGPAYYPGDGRRRQSPRGDLSLLGQEIDTLRMRLGQRLAEVAEICGLAELTIRSARQQGTVMRSRTATELARYLDTTVDQVRTWALQPARPELCYPVVTFVGTLYHPPLPFAVNGCLSCPFAEPCRHDVSRDRDGFAWCESPLAVDLDIEQLPQSRVTKT